MSLFNKEDVFTIDPDKDYSADLVGEGKKFKDLAALARGKVESDNFIAQLQRENKEYKDELQKRLTIEEVVTKISQTKQETPPPVITPQGDTPAKSLSKEDLDALIAQKLNESETKRIAQSNIEKVKAELEKTWGREYQAILDKKAQELGVGREWFNQVASEKPEAFLSLVGVNRETQKDVSPFGVSPSGINTQALANKAHRGEKTQSYYENLKKTNPKEYFNTFKEQMDQAIKLGESYFDLP